jgi:hypothetical protein
LSTDYAYPVHARPARRRDALATMAAI